jgi:hypothetical protein
MQQSCTCGSERGAPGQLASLPRPREQYQQAFRDKPDSGSVYTVRTALSATQQTAPTQQEFNRVMQTLVQSFKQYAERLRKGKPAPQSAAPK